MASLYYQREAAALALSILGEKSSPKTFDSIGNQIEKGGITAAAYVSSLLSSSAGQALYASKSDIDVLQSIYTSIYGSAANVTELQAQLNEHSLPEAIANMVTSLLNYDELDADILTSQSNFLTEVNTVLYPGTSAAGEGSGASDILALYYLTGIIPVTNTVVTLGSQINDSSKTLVQVANEFVNARVALTSLSDTSFITQTFAQGYGRGPTSNELASATSFLAAGGTRGELLVNVITDLRGTVSSNDYSAQQYFLTETAADAAGTLAGLAEREQVASIYLAIPQRNVDAGGLDDWSNYLSNHSTTLETLTKKLLSSVEFQKKGAQLTGDAFIQHVYTAVHGVAATTDQLALYRGLKEKSDITVMIIDDLRTSTATDNATVSQQHAFEADIGSSLLYKTAATLSSTAAGGNATGTVNIGSSHVLSNAETAVLQNVVLNAGSASSVNLKFADQLANLTINGSSAATVNLSNNGINTGVNVAVNNANVILNAGSGADRVTLTNTAAVNTGTGQFNLGLGNDILSWAGNAVVGGANSVSTSLKANGGAGSNVLSANLITKSVQTTTNLLGTKSTISSNVNNFSNFDKIDLAGYIGKSSSVSTNLLGTKQIETANHTFDYGLLNHSATVEGIDGGDITQATSIFTAQTLGTQGFVLSGFAEDVHVLNVAGRNLLTGVNPTQLEVTGNATAASNLGFTFVQNAASKFDINFTAHSDTDINAGAISLTSSSNGILGTALETVNIASGGSGDFTNLLTLSGGNQITTVKATGDHLLDLTIGSALTSVRTIDASGNTAGVNITTDITGTGTGSLAEFINQFPFGSVLTTLYGLNGQSINITGTTTADTFTVKDNTTITGNGGNDKFEIVSSSSTSSVKIADYNYASNSILDVTSNLLVSTDTGGTKVADYGFKTASQITSPPTTILGNLLASLLGLDSLSAKVGISSVDNNHFLIIDQNDNGKLDNADTVVTLVGNTHGALVNNLYYAEA